MSTRSAQFTQAPANTELTKLTGKGKIPTWVQGKLVRNGPALFELESTSLKHWFDGYGMLHGFLFKDGEVYYQSKYIESDEYINATQSGKVATVAWGTASDPCRSVFRRFMANFTAHPTNTNVNVIKVGEKYYTTSDIAAINEFDVDSLDTLSNFTAAKSAVMAAHPSYTNDNNAWNMTSSFGPVAKNTFVELTDAPSTIKHASFQTKNLYYFHSFGNTDRYQISIEQPMQLNFSKLVKSGITNTSFYECFEWKDDTTNTLHVYDRSTKKVTKISTDLKFFFFHTINAFEKDSIVTLDLCGYKNNSIVDDFYIDTLSTTGIPDAHKASMRRLTIDLNSKTVSEKDSQVNVELPSINDAYRNKPNRYAYGVHSPKGNTNLAVQVIKYNNENETHELWGKDELTVGEPIFIAHPQAKSEDDGVLVVLCHNSKKSLSELVVLDAENLAEIGSFTVPQSLPPALHGWFYKTKK